MRPVLLRDPGTPNLASARAFLFWLARRQIGNLALGGLYGAVWMGCQAAIPLALGAAVQAVVEGSRPALVTWSLAILGLGLVQAAAGALRHREAVTNRLIAATTVQRLVAAQASRLGGDLARQVSSGEVAGIGSNDVRRIANVLDLGPRVIGAVVAVALVAGVLIATSLPLGLVVVVGVPATALVVGPLMGPLERRQRVQRELIGAAASITADTVVGLRVLRGLGGEQIFLERFRAASQRIRRAAVSTARMSANLEALEIFIPGALMVAITALGAHLVLVGQVTPGTLVTAFAEAAFLLIPLQTAIEAAYSWTAGQVGAGRVVAMLSKTAALPDPVAPLPASPEPDICDEASDLRLPYGSFTALVSVDGQAASELVRRLARYADPGAPHRVLLGGVPISQVRLSEVRRRVVLLSKDATLLAGSIRDLLEAVAVPGSPGVGECLDAADAAEMVEALPDGLDTELPERGRTLSGGQRQRLLLAAALRSSPDVLILDEPTSAVDAHTEAAIARKLGRLRRGRTTLVVTTSPLVCAATDQVMVLDRRVRDTGTHADLLRTSAAYRRLINRNLRQASPEEVAP